jgi:hypothetical protein
MEYIPRSTLGSKYLIPSNAELRARYADYQGNQSPFASPTIYSAPNPNYQQPYPKEQDTSGVWGTLVAIWDMLQLELDQNKYATPGDFETSEANIIRQRYGMPPLPVQELDWYNRFKMTFGPNSLLVRAVDRLTSLKGEDAAKYAVGAVILGLGIYGAKKLYNYLFTTNEDLAKRGESKEQQIINERAPPKDIYGPSRPSNRPEAETTYIQPIKGETQVGKGNIPFKPDTDNVDPLYGQEPPNNEPPYGDEEPYDEPPYGEDSEEEAQVKEEGQIIKPLSELTHIPTVLKADIDDILRVFKKKQVKRRRRVDDTEQIQTEIFRRMQMKINGPDYFDYEGTHSRNTSTTNEYLTGLKLGYRY